MGLYNFLCKWDDVKAATKATILGHALKLMESSLTPVFARVGNLFVIRNFMQTIEVKGKTNINTDEYLRTADVMLVYHTGEVLLISDHEANNIMPLLRSSNTLQRDNRNVYLTHFAHMRHDKLCPSGSRRRPEAVTLPIINTNKVHLNSNGMLFWSFLMGTLCLVVGFEKNCAINYFTLKSDRSFCHNFTWIAWIGSLTE